MDDSSLDMLAEMLATPESERRHRLARLSPPLLVDLVLLALRDWRRDVDRLTGKLECSETHVSRLEQLLRRGLGNG